MSKVFCLTYSDSVYEKIQDNLCAHIFNMGMNVIIQRRQFLESLNFFNNYKNIFNQQRGGGYWLWKPLIIQNALHGMNEGEILFYIDSGDWIDKNPKDFLLNRMSDCDILLTKGGHPNKDYTKRDCFVLMDCDKEEYHNVIQVEAGIIVLKKTDFAIKFVQEWLNWCTDERILTDIPNTCGKDNFPTFIDHRHDQSVLTNLMLKYNIMCTDEMRKFITCNVNKP